MPLLLRDGICFLLELHIKALTARAAEKDTLLQSAASRAVGAVTLPHLQALRVAIAFAPQPQIRSRSIADATGPIRVQLYSLSQLEAVKIESPLPSYPLFLSSAPFDTF